MLALHTLQDYIDALRSAQLLTECTVDDALARRSIDCFSYDNRQLSGTALFLCKGAHFKEAYLLDALARGAVAYVADHPYGVDAPRLIVSDIRHALVVLGRLYYNNVTDKLVTVGITGTKGKSTTAYYMRYLLNDWLSAQGKPDCALVSSIDTYDGVICEESHITTPEVLELYQHFQNAYDSGITHLVMEASSQSFKVGRVRGMTFDVGAFLNIGEDHISPKEHPDLEDYFRTKLRIFDQARQAVVNLDEPRCAEVLRAAGRCEKTITYSMTDPAADLFGFDLIHNGASMEFSVNMAGRTERFVLPMAGDFNVSNALAALALAQTLGVPVEYMRQGLSRASVPGRMEVISENGKTVVIDYAHNGMSLAALLRSVRQGYPEQPVTVVFGCTGGKGLIRRQGMGEAAAGYADRIILTEDDPGPEEVEAICAEVGRVIAAAGKDYAIIADREEAVRQALMDSPRPGVVVLAGRGRQEYQLRKNGPQTFPTDCDLARKYLA
jgi:UDP-N-acetylmuramoyl-L-alanyl-D-glutamate--2,6-diaminopimelate ligase